MDDEDDEFKKMKEDFNSMNSLSDSLAMNALIGKTQDAASATIEQTLTSPGGPFDQIQKTQTGTFQQMQSNQILTFNSSQKMQNFSQPSVNEQKSHQGSKIEEQSRESHDAFVKLESLPPRPMHVKKQNSKVSVDDIKSKKSTEEGNKTRVSHKKSNLSIGKEPSIKNFEPIQLSTRKPYLKIQENYQGSHGW